MSEVALKNKCTERAKIFQQAMESCKSSSPMDCIEWFADRIADLEATNKKISDECHKLVDSFEKTQNENAELKNQVSFLEDNLRVARKDREKLQLDVAKGLKEFVKDYPATSLRYLANEKYVDQLTKAKICLEQLVSEITVGGLEVDPNILQQAEQFLSEVEK